MATENSGGGLGCHRAQPSAGHRSIPNPTVRCFQREPWFLFLLYLWSAADRMHLQESHSLNLHRSFPLHPLALVAAGHLVAREGVQGFSPEPPRSARAERRAPTAELQLVGVPVVHKAVAKGYSCPGSPSASPLRCSTVVSPEPAEPQAGL